MAEPRNRNRAPAVKRDALIEAVIRKLPSEGTPFLVDARVAWLRMAVQAFDVAYGVVEGVAVTWVDPNSARHVHTKFDGVYEHGPGAVKVNDLLSNVTPLRRPTQEEIDALDEPRYYIRKDGMAFGPGNKRIKATEVPASAIIEDERPAGEQDLEAVVWADGTWPTAALPSLNIVAA